MLENNQQLFGIYRAIVTDTSCFEQTGKIKTRISAFNSGAVSKDLIDGYDSDSFSNIISRDILTDIMLPFGGGYDYGMFKLPPINSVGLVAFIDASRSTPIWIGATANHIFNNDKQLVQLDFPSDKNNNEAAVYYSTEVGKPVFNFNDKNAFIINTKTNELDDLTKPETMVWQNNPVENSFILSSTEARLYHRIDDYSYQEFVLSNNKKTNTGEIGLSYIIDEEDEFKKIVLDGDTITIRDKNGDNTAQIILDDKGNIFINSAEDNTGNKRTGSRIETSIELTPASINIKAGHSRITMSRNINQDNEKITISANNLQIDARNVSFGSSGYSFVVSPNSNLNFTLEDGSMLTTANNIRT